MLADASISILPQTVVLTGTEIDDLREQKAELEALLRDAEALLVAARRERDEARALLNTRDAQITELGAKLATAERRAVRAMHTPSAGQYNSSY